MAQPTSWAVQCSLEADSAREHASWVTCWLARRQRWLATSRWARTAQFVSRSSTRAAGHRGPDLAQPSNSGTEPNCEHLFSRKPKPETENSFEYSYAGKNSPGGGGEPEEEEHHLLGDEAGDAPGESRSL